ncbi:MAG TPA: DNA-formamidopyrimidine glycosylase family protein [Bryobacteraceae bacterium]|jgi:formamidopyrimidine-DNA glycosylase
MPELPDIAVYIEALESRILGEIYERTRLASPFLLRTVDPQLEELENRRVLSLRRIGKRIAVQLDGDLWFVLHLMIAGRLHWKKHGTALPKKRAPAAFDFSNGTLLLTEAGTERRASLHLVRGTAGLEALDPGGIDPLKVTAKAFREALTAGNHTLKRTLTDPRILSGIGNAYSDEILHRAQLSPILMTQKMTTEQLEELRGAVKDVLVEWTVRLRDEAKGGFPEKVTAFRPEMAVHGKYGEPCPRCGDPVQRIRYASNETNYCARCQTGGKLLADRALSRLLGSDWPRSLEELENLKRK